MIYKANKGQTAYGQPIGIILMESHMPFPPGCPGNATSHDFPVRYEIVKEATMDTLVYKGDEALIEPFKEAGWKLINEGVRAVTGNCGFMVLYQDLLAAEFPVPTFMSSLLQLSFISRMLKPDEYVGIITASDKTLTPRHIEIATNGVPANIETVGMEDRPFFKSAIHEECGELDFEGVTAEVVAAGKELIERNGSIKAILLECTDLPPYAAALQEAIGLPVFDYSTMINYVFSGLVRKPFQGYC